MSSIYPILLFLFYSPVKAQVLTSEIPDYLLEQSYSDLSHRALKRACNASLAVVSTIPCNPNSLIALPDKSFFFVNVYGSDQLEDIREIDTLFRDDKSVEAVEEILREQSPINAQASASVNYAKENFSVSVIPIRASLFSFTRNPINP